MQCIAFVLASVLAVADCSAVNYCGARMCRNTNSHTFCQFPEGPSPHCVGYISARLSLEEKARILARLNRRRNEAAAGKMRGLPTAGNMLKLRWVEELAREAQRWADQCRPPRTPEEHDACRDLYSISVGQCVASVVGEAPGLRVESMVDIWYMQSILYKGNITFYMPPAPNASYYGDFAQIIWARTYMVGCGRSRFMTPWHGRLRSVERLVCNLAPLGPTPSRPLWAPAAPTASCPSRSQRDAAMTALCDFQRESKEIMYVDPSTPLEDHILLNTVLEIEADPKLDYLGSLDEHYLTRMAIATMENTITTQSFFNSMQRREIVERVQLSDIITNVTTSVAQDVVIPLPNTTVSANKTTNKTDKKKINIVGRPKTYKVEDLTDFEVKTENTPNTPTETDLSKKKEKEMYGDYEFLETADDSLATTIEITNGSEVANVTIIDDFADEVVTSLYQNLSIPKGAVLDLNNASFNMSTETLNSTESSPKKESTMQDQDIPFLVKDSNIDDYFTDPETVRELQEALERIEHDMESKTTNQKVRRELREFPTDAQVTPQIEKLQAHDSFKSELRNRTLDSQSPMYNMVLKYMPYLKQYDGGLLSGSDENSVSGKSGTPSLILVVILCNGLGIF